jgi:hypothetical protein
MIIIAMQMAALVVPALAGKGEPPKGGTTNVPGFADSLAASI